MSHSPRDLRSEFHDSEYRQAYADDYLNTYIATQIQVLREQRGLSQEQLADQIGTKQPGISRLENVNHSSWKTDTLKKIAVATDTWLKISFESYGDLLTEARGFGRNALKRPKFEDDPFFKDSPLIQVTTLVAGTQGEPKASQLKVVASNEGRVYQRAFTLAGGLQSVAPISASAEPMGGSRAAVGGK